MEQWINELTFNSDINLQQLVSFSDNLKTQVSSSFAPGICPSPMNRKYIFVLYSIELYLFTHIVMYGAYKCTKWRCRKCHFINEGFNIAICKKCSCPKSSGESLQVLPGDWTCNECNCSNFARRQNCYKCSLPRPKKAKFKEIPADQDCLRVGELLCDDTQQIDGDPSPKNEGETLIIPDSYQNEDDETHSNPDSDASTTIGAEDEVSENGEIEDRSMNTRSTMTSEFSSSCANGMY